MVAGVEFTSTVLDWVQCRYRLVLRKASSTAAVKIPLL